MESSWWRWIFKNKKKTHPLITQRNARNLEKFQSNMSSEILNISTFLSLSLSRLLLFQSIIRASTALVTEICNTAQQRARTQSKVKFKASQCRLCSRLFCSRSGDLWYFSDGLFHIIDFSSVILNYGQEREREKARDSINKSHREIPLSSIYECVWEIFAP